MTTPLSLQNQVALVTGASRGLGLAVAEELSRVGTKVVMVARSAERLAAVAEELTAAGGQVLAIPADVSDLTQAQQVVAEAVAHFGRLDILVNNAAIIGPIDKVHLADPIAWTNALQINLFGPFYLIQQSLPTMLAQGSGRIINVSSGLSSHPYTGFSAYGASKAGVDQLTRILALELTGSGVTANSVYPGMISTDMQSEIRQVNAEERQLDLSMFRQAEAAGQLISAATAARRILWLAGPWSQGRNGEIFTFRDSTWLTQVEQDLA